MPQFFGKHYKCCKIMEQYSAFCIKGCKYVKKIILENTAILLHIEKMSLNTYIIHAVILFCTFLNALILQHLRKIILSKITSNQNYWANQYKSDNYNSISQRNTRQRAIKMTTPKKKKFIQMLQETHKIQYLFHPNRI